MAFSAQRSACDSTNVWSMLVAPDGLKIPLYIVLLLLQFCSDLYVIQISMRTVTVLKVETLLFEDLVIETYRVSV